MLQLNPDHNQIFSSKYFGFSIQVLMILAQSEAKYGLHGLIKQQAEYLAAVRRIWKEALMLSYRSERKLKQIKLCVPKIKFIPGMIRLIEFSKSI